MGIVVITMPGASKLAFAATLNKKTKGAVSLVIVQRSVSVTFKHRFARVKKNLYKGSVFRDIWYGLLLRLNPQTQKTLEYFRESEVNLDPIKDRLPDVLEVDSVNSDETYQVLKEISPDLIVVWGSKILKPRIIETAKNAINLHIGRCPEYRGTLANQHAVLDGNFQDIGATIHYIVPAVDAGDILSVIDADFSKKPKHIFQDLITRAQASYITIAVKLYEGQEIHAHEQGPTMHNILKLENWSPQVRYTVARKVRMWERGLIKLGKKGELLSSDIDY